MAHIIATQQILVYRWSGIPTRVDEAWVDLYMKGTFPQQELAEDAIEELSELLLSSVDLVREDYRKGLFENYKEYTTSTKTTLSSVEDAISFNNFHEGYHLGAVVSLQKVLGAFPY